MSTAEVERLNPYEGYPKKYGRFPVKVTAYKMSEETDMPPKEYEIEAFPYIMHEEKNN